MPVRLFVLAVLAAAIVALAAPATAGASFTVVPSPNAPAGESVLTGVRASSATDAWAVGSSCCRSNNFGRATLTEHWNGSAWSVVPSLDTRFNDELLNAVIDISPSNAWAVGETKQSGYRSGAPLILHWNGTSWQPVAPPSGTTGKLLAATFSSSTDLWAVGDDNHGHALVLHSAGGAWSRVPVPELAPSVQLRGARAFSPNDLWVVGGEGTAGTLVLHWNGVGWTRIASPNPDPYSNVLHAVDFFAPRGLGAVGQRARSKTSTGVPPGTRTLAMHWDGTRWTTVATPDVGDEDTLRGVVGTSGGGMTAVGTYQDVTTGALRTLAERWNGTSWAVRPTPNVGAADNLLRAVSTIPGSPDVWAVGFHLTAGGPTQTLVLRGS
ncbi:MAG TPA: hypothetical protein VF520_03880 [Thermoleophilaceae bacterium]|jgi:hypothetical protein